MLYIYFMVSRTQNHVNLYSGHVGLLDPLVVADHALRRGLPSHRGAGAQEVRAPRLEHSLRVQPGGFQRQHPGTQINEPWLLIKSCAPIQFKSNLGSSDVINAYSKAY